eukprot:1157984-Pelagomonas_calceolata.AAC.7
MTSTPGIKLLLGRLLILRCQIMWRPQGSVLVGGAIGTDVGSIGLVENQQTALSPSAERRPHCTSQHPRSTSSW